MKPRVALIAALAPILLAGALAAAPPPLTAPFNVTTAFAPTEQVDYRKTSQPGAAALANGDFAIAWFYEFGQGVTPSANGLNGRRVSFRGELGRESEFFYNWEDPYGVSADCPALAATGSGGFELAYRWQEQVGAVLVVNGAIASDNENTDDESVGCPALAAAPDGRSVLAWADFIFSGDYPYPSTYKVRVFDAGQPLGPAFSLDGVGSDLFNPPAVGMDRAGRFVAVWRGIASPGLFARRFAADGTPVGSPFLIAASYASDPVISMAPEGDFAVAYTKPAAAGKPQALIIRRFAAEGSEIGTPISPGTVAEFISPKASTDRYGNFVLYWQEKNRTRAQVFNRSRAARGPSFDAGPTFEFGQGATAVALADSGRLLTAWSAGDDLRGRIWRGLKEDSYCVYRGNTFLCDAAVNGQEVPAAALGLGYPTDVPLLGDIDGDGRVDACTHRGNRFLCDTKHDGGVAEVKIAFGVPGDLGLLGDVDGDGKADVCIYRNGVFACDTAHDGVFAEVKLDLRPALQGMTAGVPLLGDIDGDGRADACLLRGAELTCGLFNKTGGAPYAVVDRPVFLQPGDLPLLGGLVN